MKLHRRRNIHLIKWNFPKILPFRVWMKQKNPMLQSILPLTSSAAGEFTFIPASNVPHTELLNSKINKRIKTDKRMNTYTQARVYNTLQAGTMECGPSRRPRIYTSLKLDEKRGKAMEKSTKWQNIYFIFGNSTHAHTCGHKHERQQQ